jgi:hypothetical protein
MSYRHVQHGWFHWLLVAFALLWIGAAFVVEPLWIRLALFAMAGLFGLLAALFSRLEIASEGRHLVARFGLLGFPSRRVAYDDIESFERARSTLIDGWGIHWVPGRGWTWNLWGRDCVELETRGGFLRLGTDDPEGLVAHLTERVRPGRRGA